MQQEWDILDKQIYIYIYKILHINLRERDIFEVSIVDGRIILKHTTKKENGRQRTGGSCEYGNVPSDSKNTRNTLSG
jgi:hypothetical protein